MSIRFTLFTAVFFLAGVVSSFPFAQDVHWDVMRAVKECFDTEGISIPFAQRDVHLFNETAPAAAEATAGHP